MVLASRMVIHTNMVVRITYHNKHRMSFRSDLMGNDSYKTKINHLPPFDFSPLMLLVFILDFQYCPENPNELMMKQKILFSKSSFAPYIEFFRDDVSLGEKMISVNR